MKSSGTCSVCDLTRPLNRDGTLRSHQVPIYGMPFGKRCEGSHRTPKEARPTAQEYLP